MSEDDPLSFLASGSGNKSKGASLFDDEPISASAHSDSSAFSSSSSSLFDDEPFLRQADASKFANKASVQKQKAKLEQEAAAVQAAAASQPRGAKTEEKGLGFGSSITLSDTNANTNKNLKDFDLLENLADKDKLSDLQSSIFASLTGNDGDSSSSGSATKQDGTDDLFGGKGSVKLPSSSSSGGGGSLRVGGRQQHVNETNIDDLSNSKAFLEKESEDDLDYELFGISKTKQTVKKQAEALKRDVVKHELGDIGLENSDALDKLEALTVEDNTASSAAPVVASSVAAPEAVTDVDMDALDLDAYIASMSGGGDGDGNGDGTGSGGGGLFD